MKIIIGTFYEMPHRNIQHVKHYMKTAQYPDESASEYIRGFFSSKEITKETANQILESIKKGNVIR